MIATTNRIYQIFKQQREKKNPEKLMNLFITAGYPDLDSTVDLVLGMEENGADMVEIGMPFSDPLADGPTIQFSSETAIDNGITLEKIFGMCRQIREKSGIPIVLMGYVNPVLHYGAEKFMKKASEAGVDGLILPDLPIEESYLIEEARKAYNIPQIYLVAPNTSDERMKTIDKKSEGFVYCVSVTGVTGAREGDEVARSVNRFIDRVNENITENPKMVGFGIKSHRDAKLIAEKVEGFIVGSALIDTIREHYPRDGWKEKVFEFVHELKYGN